MRGSQLRNSLDFDPMPFLEAQKASWSQAMMEISNGKKRGHWIWFMFPQLRALGNSTYSEIYGLDGVSEARCFYRHAILRMRLDKAVEAVLDSPQRDVNVIFDTLDCQKFHACLTLFNHVEPNHIFRQALTEKFKDNPHEETLRLLRTTKRENLFQRMPVGRKN
jgi:uncharacterized protein (DUF1810 family)